MRYILVLITKIPPGAAIHIAIRVHIATGIIQCAIGVMAVNVIQSVQRKSVARIAANVCIVAQTAFVAIAIAIVPAVPPVLNVI